MGRNSLPREKKFELWGWVLFLVSAVFYIVGGIRNGDVVGVLGAVFFFVACIVFLIPFLSGSRRRSEE